MTKVTLTLFQHSWSAKGLDPDGAAYATEAEADAAEIAAARDQLNDESGDDIAEAITESADADEIDAARLDVIRALGEDADTDALTDRECVIAAESLRGYDSAVYPITVAFDLVTLLNAVKGETGAPVAHLLEAGHTAARAVVNRWESGDLAGAVHALEGWTYDLETDFPGLDYVDTEADDEEDDDGDVAPTMTLAEAKGLKVGDFVVMNCDGSGDVDDEERQFERGAWAVVNSLDTYAGPQGFAVTVAIIYGPGRGVVNVLDEADDGGRYAFQRPHPAALPNIREAFATYLAWCAHD